MADRRVQYINGAIHSFGISIDTYIEEVDFHVMNLCTIDIMSGYPWFYNKNSSLSIEVFLERENNYCPSFDLQKKKWTIVPFVYMFY